MSGINPIDHFAISGARETKPIPHIPGAETAGVVEKTGRHVTSLKQCDRVVVYSRVFDGTCDMCLKGYEMLCRSGGIIGIMTNGGFAEYIAVPEKNVFKIPNDIKWELAASLPVTTITPYHALKEAALKVNESLLIFGALGNTVAVQFGRKMGAKVIAVSKDEWVKEFGADYVISDYYKVAEKVAFTVFRFENGKIVEHWDNTQQRPTSTISGRSMTDGPTEIKDLDKTQANKRFVQDFVQDVLRDGKVDKITYYISTETYNQHNPGVGDGLDGLSKALESMAKQGLPMEYHTLHKVIGEGNFVLTLSEGQFAGKHVAFYDLFRVESGKIVEHWDVIQDIPQKESWKNQNGKF